jgi:hypothetical protein
VQERGPALATALACYFDFFALLLIFRLRYGVMGMREIARLVCEDRAVLGNHGRGVLAGRAVHVIHDPFEVFGAASGVYRIDCRGHRALSCLGMDLPLQRD